MNTSLFTGVLAAIVLYGATALAADGPATKPAPQSATTQEHRKADPIRLHIGGTSDNEMDRADIDNRH